MARDCNSERVSLLWPESSRESMFGGRRLWEWEWVGGEGRLWEVSVG